MWLDMALFVILPICVETVLEFVETCVVDKAEAVAFKLTVTVLLDDTDRSDEPVDLEAEVLWLGTEVEDLLLGSAA